LAGLFVSFYGVLSAHAPDIHASRIDRAALVLSGHIYGGQIRLFDRVPMVPSA
jgi:predicted MPP superfamily phosphohydrolase